MKGNVNIFKKKTDLCDQKSKPSEMLKLGLGLFGIPAHCSFNATPTFCYANETVVKFSESTMRLLNAFPFNGNSAVTQIKIRHDTGSSCFETGTELIKE
jgi:hypothetical protein